MSSLRYFLGVACLAALIVLAPAAYSQSVESYYESALGYRGEGDIDAAIIELKNALQQSSDHLPSRLLLGRLLLETGSDPADAEAQFNAAIELGGDRNLIMPDLGIAWLQQRKNQQVLDFKRYNTLQPRERARWYDVRGKAYLALEDYDRAYGEFEKSLRINPEQADPITGQAYARMLQKQMTEARSLADYALELEPGNDGVLKLLGDIASAEEEFEAAMDYYNRAIAANKYNYNARLRRVVLNLSQQKFDAAEADIDEVLKVYPSNPRALVAKAMLLVRQSRNREAQRLLEEFNFRLSNISKSKLAENVNIQIIRGLTFYLQGFYGQALPVLEDINRAYPEKTFIRQMLTDTYYARGRFDEIVDLYRPITALSSSDARYVYVYAQAAWRANRFRDAELKLLEWARANPQIFGELTHLLAASYYTQGQYDDALSTIENVGDQEQARLASKLLLGTIQLEDGDLEAARKTALDMVSNHPGSGRAHNFACIVYKRMKALPTAIEYCERAIAVAGQQAAPVINLSLIFMEQERYDEAISGFNAVLAIFPMDVRAMGGLAYIAEQRGELDLAIRYTERLATFRPRETRYRLKLAEFYLAKGQAAQALEAIEYAETIEPLNPRSFVLRTQAYKQQGNLAGAASQLRFLYGMSVGENNDALPTIAAEQLSIGELEDALITINKLAETSGYENEAVLLRAEYHFLAQEPAACVSLLEPLQRKSLPVPQRKLLAQCYVSNRQPERAMAILNALLAEQADENLAVQRFRLQILSDRRAAIAGLESYVTANPRSPAALKTIADFYVMEDLSQARGVYLRLQREWPEHAAAEVSNNLANILLLEGDLAGATEQARRAYELAPDNPSVADTYGWILVQNAQYSDGLKYLREAWARRSGSDEVNYHLAYTLAKLGRSAEAMQYARNVAQPGRLSPEQQARLDDIANERPI